MSEYQDWVIVHRTRAEYDRCFPQYAQRMQSALAQEFPGANIISEHFQETSDEPIVVAPPGTPSQKITEAQAKALSAYKSEYRKLFLADQPTNIGQNANPEDSFHETPSETIDTPETPTEVNDIHGTWVVIVPMHQLEISDHPPINGKWNVGDVSFVSRNKLSELLRPPTLTNIPRPQVWEATAGEDKSFAVITLTGAPNQIRQSVFRQLREAASILAATECVYGKRHHVSGFTLKGYPAFTAKQDRFIQADGSSFCGNWVKRGFLFPFVLDEDWHQAISLSGIIDLFDRINDNTLNDDWKRQIRSGAAMLGRSLMSLDLADAFLLNVIGLETLLTRQGERNGRILFQRIKGLTGWHLRTSRPNYEAEIRSIHNVRCEIVHDSDYSNLTVELLLMADMYLTNSLLNIVRLPSTFPNKATLANILDSFSTNENWPTDNSIPFRWFGNATFNQKDLDLPLW